MATVLQFRRYSSTQIQNLTGKLGEIFINLTDNTLRLQDGSTAGGIPLKVSFSDVIGEPTTNTDLLDALNDRVSVTAYNEHVAGTADNHHAASISYGGDPYDPIISPSIDNVDAALDDLYYTKVDTVNALLKNGAAANDQTITGDSTSILKLVPLTTTGQAQLEIGSDAWDVGTDGVVSSLRLNAYRDDTINDPYGLEPTYYKMQVNHTGGNSYLQMVKNSYGDENVFLEVDPYTGDVTVENSLYVNGLLYLQGVEAETITIGGTLDSDIIPDATNTYVIGNSSYRWLSLHVGTINASGGITATTATLTGNTLTTHDVEVTDSTKGIILRSPNGSRWRITVDNDGNLTSTAL